MSRPRPSFTLGIEEEYLLVDLETRDVAVDPPREIFEECESRAGASLVEHELLRSQIEVDTCVCRSVAEARRDLARLRQLTADAAARYGLAPIAASTHPFAEWHLQRRTDKSRFRLLARDMQSLSRRMLICGMHVHVGIEDDELRLELMNRFTPYLPLLLALSTSSPFWQGELTGLKSFRLTVFDGFPRTGLPERFASYGDYRRHLDILTKAGVMEDATFIWWDLRISERYPTLESRIADVCTRLDDAASIAALTQSTLHYLFRTRADRPDLTRFMVDQNRWRAMRYGLDQGLVDFGSSRIVPVSDCLAELVERVRPDAAELGCLAELEHALEIPARGTSAHLQVETYRHARRSGADVHQALRAVVDRLIAETTGHDAGGRRTGARAPGRAPAPACR
jgi:carboxylate-amine ligase